MITPVVSGAVTPLGVLSVTISTVLAPLVAWLVRNATKALKRQVLLDAKVKDLKVTVDKLNSTSTSHEGRLSKVEDAICDIRSAVQRSDEQYAAINQKLEVMPRVMTLLETVQTAIAAIVPRNEVESRMAAAEHRLQLVEQDVRKVNR